jgi:signal transduction histidine kinase
MQTPDEQRRNLESRSTGEMMEGENMGSGTDLPSLGVAGSPTTAFQETERHLIELLATIGHEFRTPLAVINGYASTLLRQQHQLSTQEQHEYLHMIQEAGKRLEILTDRLLEIAQLEAGTVQIESSLVNIPSLAQEVIASAQQQVPEPLRDRFTFHLHCRDEVGNQTQEVPAVHGDVRSLRKVFEHLLENAIRFSPEGGRIDVIARPVRPGRTASVHDQPLTMTAFLEICVCDYGVGIPDEHLERIFERFYQVDTSLTREANGLGLGLTMCKYLVALHEGRIWAESCPAGGSVFHIWLPLKEPQLDDQRGWGVTNIVG